MGFNDIYRILGYIYDPRIIRELLRDDQEDFYDTQRAYHSCRNMGVPIHTYEVAGIHYEVFETRSSIKREI